MKLISTIIVLLLVGFGITFAILNSEAVVLNYYFGKYEVSLSLLLVFTLAAGAVVGFSLSTPSLFRLKRGNRQLRAQIKQAQTEVDNLRSIPIRNSH